MTVQELIDQAEVLSEEIYAEAKWIGFINDALNDLTPVAKMLYRVDLGSKEPDDNGRIVITIGDEAELAMLHSIIEVYHQVDDGIETKLKRVSPSNVYSKGWKRTQDKIILQEIPEEGNILLDIYKRLGHVTVVGDTPELPEQYHQLILLFMCSRSQQKEEELEDKLDFYNEYILSKRQFAIDRMWEMEPHLREQLSEEKARIALQYGEARG